MQTKIAFDYAGTVPGANANETVLFSTVSAGIPKNAILGTGVKRYVLVVDNPEAGSVYLYWSPDRGTTWIQISTTTVAAPAAGACATVDLLIEGLPDVKVTWKNGGVAQTGWALTQWLTDERAEAA